MDVSSEYVKMCEKAVEIQALAPKPTILGGNFWHYPEGATGAPIVWLPRQDQLQEMLFDTEHIFARVVLLKEFVRQNERYILNKMRSFEQLWLAFVMQERYSKIWNGEDWIKKLGGEHE